MQSLYVRRCLPNHAKPLYCRLSSNRQSSLLIQKILWTSIRHHATSTPEPKEASPPVKKGLFRRLLTKMNPFAKKPSDKDGPSASSSATGSDATSKKAAIKQEREEEEDVASLTYFQRFRRKFAVARPVEKLLLDSNMTDDTDLARLISKTVAIGVYAFVGITALGTLGVDTKPLVTGLGITGFTIGFALKEVATNFLSGIFLVFQKPFEKGCRLKIHGSGGGIEGLVESIDVRYVILKTQESGLVMIPSAIVYSNPITVFRSIEKNLMAPQIDRIPPHPAQSAALPKASESKSQQPIKILTPGDKSS